MKRPHAKTQANQILPSARACESCGMEISRKRLAAMPGARLCVACQSRVDTPIRATDRRVMNALVERSEYDEEMFAPEAHE